MGVQGREEEGVGVEGGRAGGVEVGRVGLEGMGVVGGRL